MARTTIPRAIDALRAGATIACAMLALSAIADDAQCSKCHAPLFQRKSVHGAVPMGCRTCHVEMDAASPHQVRGKVAKGLAGEPLALCNDCHEKRLYEGKVVHAPVAAGICLVCHDPHASDHAGLLRKPPATLCLDCHPEIAKTPHVIAGFSRSGHPLGEEGRERPAQDPLRPGKKFYCAACHEPHRSELPALNRFPKGMSSCRNCHRM